VVTFRNHLGRDRHTVVKLAKIPLHFHAVMLWVNCNNIMPKLHKHHHMAKTFTRKQPVKFRLPRRVHEDKIKFSASQRHSTALPYPCPNQTTLPPALAAHIHYADAS